MILHGETYRKRHKKRYIQQRIYLKTCKNENTKRHIKRDIHGEKYKERYIKEVYMKRYNRNNIDGKIYMGGHTKNDIQKKL